MTPSTLQLLVFIIFLAHGAGHYMGVVTALGYKLSSTSSYSSWFFGTGYGSRMVCFILYFLAIIGFVLTALSLKNYLILNTYWESLAIISALISISCLLFF